MAIQLQCHPGLKSRFLKTEIEAADTREQTYRFEHGAAGKVGVIRIDAKVRTPGDRSQETVLSIQAPHIEIKLREAIEAHRERTGVRLTYAALAAATGLSEATLQSLAARPTYNPRLSTIARLCNALGCVPGDLLGLSGSRE